MALALFDFMLEYLQTSLLLAILFLLLWEKRPKAVEAPHAPLGQPQELIRDLDVWTVWAGHPQEGGKILSSIRHGSDAWYKASSTPGIWLSNGDSLMRCG